MINLGIIGAGYMAEKYMEVLDNSYKFKVQCIAANTIKSSRKLSKKYKIKYFYNDYKEMLKQNKLDAVIIACSIINTSYILEYILNQRIPVLVEKPVSLNFSIAKKLAKIASKNKTKNMVALNRRFYSNMQKVKELTKKDKISNIIIEGHERFWKIKGNYNDRVEKKWLFANSIHTIDLLSFFGGKIKKINIFKKKQYHNNGDNFNVSIEFENNILASYISNWFVPGGWSVKIYTQNNFFNFTNLENCSVTNKDFINNKIRLNHYDKKYKTGLFLMLNTFYEYVVNDIKLDGYQSINDNLNTMKIIQKLYDY